MSNYKLDKPLFTIITVSYNSEATIQNTIESVLEQNFQSFEYVIIDGKSSDNTLLIIEKYIPKFKQKNIKFRIISEKDRGIYDAMNKGMHDAKGEYLTFLNSDDVFTNNDVLERIYDRIKLTNCEILFSNIKIVNFKEDILRKWKVSIGNIYLGWMPPHPGTFVNTKIAQSVQYSLEYKIASDSKWLIELIQKKTSMTILNYFTVNMLTGGLSNNGFRSKYKAFKEVVYIYRELNFNFPILIAVLKIFRKTFQIQSRVFKKEKNR